jgi:O-antigen/teichoic acid export membrane protein
MSGTTTSPHGRRAVVTGTMWQASAQLVPLAINLGLTPYFIRGLGIERYSVFLLVNTISAVLSTLNGGLGQSAMRFFSINVGNGDRAASTRLLWTVSWIFVGLTAVVSTAGVLGAPALLDFFSLAPELRPETVVLVNIVVVLVGIIMLRNLFNTLLIAHGRFQVTALAILTGYVVFAVGMILTIERGWGLVGVGWTYIVQQIVGSLITVPVAVPLLDRAGRTRMGRAEAATFFAYAWKVQVTGLLAVVTAQKDQLVAGRLLTAQLSGPYGQGSNFAQQLKMIPLNALGPLQSSLGRTVGEVGAADAAAAVNRMQRMWVLAVTGWVAVGLPATYVGVRTWLPDAFAVSAQVATILFVGSFFTLLPAVLVLWCLTVGHPELELRYSLVGLLVNVIGSVGLGLAFGILGVVVGTTLSQIAATAWLAWDVRRTLPVRLDGLFRHIAWRDAALAGGITLAVELLALGHLPRGAIGLATCGALAVPGAALYAVLAFGRETVVRVLRRMPALRRFA